MTVRRLYLGGFLLLALLAGFLLYALVPKKSDLALVAAQQFPLQDTALDKSWPSYRLRDHLIYFLYPTYWSPGEEKDGVVGFTIQHNPTEESSLQVALQPGASLTLEAPPNGFIRKTMLLEHLVNGYPARTLEVEQINPRQRLGWFNHQMTTQILLGQQVLTFSLSLNYRFNALSNDQVGQDIAQYSKILHSLTLR